MHLSAFRRGTRTCPVRSTVISTKMLEALNCRSLKLRINRATAGLCAEVRS
jgi:hypothetical protein